MDSMAAILEGEWMSSLSSLSGMYTTDQEADFMSQLLTNCPLIPNELDGISSTFWSSSEMANSSNYSALFDSHPIFVANNSSPMSIDFCMEDAANTSSYLVVEGDDYLMSQEIMSNGNQNGNISHQEPALLHITNLEPKRDSDRMIMPQPEESITENVSENSKKRSRGTSGDHGPKVRRNARSKKNQSNVSATEKDIEDGNGGVVNGQTSASCSSEDDSNIASQDVNGEAALNLNGKTRASRGAATDPQSLYARKRRERINERLRILQKLVPNGTKVDISTMLEEAVQYVKFLQLQIKLLSSDDLWMYAPLAYNGMDIGLDHLKLATPKRS